MSTTVDISSSPPLPTSNINNNDKDHLSPEELERQERDLDDQLSELDGISSVVESPLQLLAANLQSFFVFSLFLTFLALTSACSERLGAGLVIILFRLLLHTAVVSYQLPIADLILELSLIGAVVAVTQLQDLGYTQCSFVYLLLILPEYALRTATENLSETENPLRVKVLKAVVMTVPQICVVIICLVLTKGGFFFNAISYIVGISTILFIILRAVKMLAGTTENESDENTGGTSSAVVEEREELNVNDADNDRNDEQKKTAKSSSSGPSLSVAEQETRGASAKITKIAKRIQAKKMKLEEKLSDRSPLFFLIIRRISLSSSVWIPFFFSVLLVLQIINLTTWKSTYRQVAHEERYIKQVRINQEDLSSGSKFRGNNEDYYNNNNGNNNNNNNNNKGQGKIIRRSPQYRGEWRTRTTWTREKVYSWKKQASKQIIAALLLFFVESVLLNMFLPFLNSNAFLKEKLGGSLFSTPRSKRLFLSVLGFILIIPVRSPLFIVGFVILASIPVLIYRDAVEVAVHSRLGEQQNVEDTNSNLSSNERSNTTAVTRDLLYEKLRADFILAVLLTGFALHHAPKASFNVAFTFALVSYAGLAFVLFRGVGKQFGLV